MDRAHVGGVQEFEAGAVCIDPPEWANATGQVIDGEDGHGSEGFEVATEFLLAFAPGVPGVEDTSVEDVDVVTGNVCNALFWQVADMQGA
jgi:hypothetical protein